MKKFIYTLCILAILLVCTVPASYAHAKPDEISVSDFSGVLSDTAKSYIKSKNDILYSHADAKIIFVTTESTDGMGINDYCETLYSNWGISYLGRRNSILIVIDTVGKEYAFVRGRNMRFAITDTQLYKYMVDYFEPHFANDSYDKAVLTLYNALGNWYEQHYNNLSLGLDENVERYMYGEKTKDKELVQSKLWLWIAIGVCLVLLVIVLKIKRNIELKVRQHERRRLRRKFKIDIDKIVNS